jgi:hypothetical protein
MDTICLNDVRMLIQSGGGLYVSIFMPTHHRGGMDQQDPIRFKNLLRNSEEKLVAKGMRAAESRVMLKPAESLITDNLFWRQQGDGLALFMAANQYFYYRLPIVLKEEVGVGDRYYIRPLISLLSNCGLFYVLAVSQNENRLLQCTSNGSVRVNLNGIPKNLNEALHYEIPDSNTQFHTISQVSGGSGGTSIQSEAVSRADYSKSNILQYFEQVNKGIAKIMKSEQAPLMLAGVDYLHPLYRKANTYRNLLQEGILGNPDGVNDDVLREQAWTIVRPYFDGNKRAAVADFKKSAGTGLTASGLVNVLPAAHQGRVRFLFLVEGTIQWGNYQEVDGQVMLHDKAELGDEDLMDLAAFQTLKHDGSVYVLKAEEMPGAEMTLAILRY